MFFRPPRHERADTTDKMEFRVVRDDAPIERGADSVDHFVDAPLTASGALSGRPDEHLSLPKRRGSAPRGEDYTVFLLQRNDAQPQQKRRPSHRGGLILVGAGGILHAGCGCCLA